MSWGAAAILTTIPWGLLTGGSHRASTAHAEGWDILTLTSIADLPRSTRY